MTTALIACLAGLGLALALCVARMVLGPSLPNRVVALDALVSVVLAGVAVGAALSGDGVFIDVLLVVALVGFVSTTAVARYLERGER